MSDLTILLCRRNGPPLRLEAPRYDFAARTITGSDRRGSVVEVEFGDLLHEHLVRDHQGVRDPDCATTRAEASRRKRQDHGDRHRSETRDAKT